MYGKIKGPHRFIRMRLPKVTALEGWEALREGEERKIRNDSEFMCCDCDGMLIVQANGPVTLTGPLNFSLKRAGEMEDYIFQRKQSIEQARKISFTVLLFAIPIIFGFSFLFTSDIIKATVLFLVAFLFASVCIFVLPEATPGETVSGWETKVLLPLRVSPVSGGESSLPSYVMAEGGYLDTSAIAASGDGDGGDGDGGGD